MKKNSRHQSTFQRQSGFLKLPNDNIFKTLIVAFLLCLVCSIIVSTSAIVLKPAQVANMLLDKKKNILSVAGISGEGSIDDLFQQIETRVIDMSTGEYTDAVDALTYDERRAANDPEYRVALNRDQDIAQIGALAKYSNVYLVRNGEQVSKYILPIRGYGLWGTLYGFIALHSDGETVSRITFYEHKETPGLGAKVENVDWQASWDGKQIFDEAGEPALHVIKGLVNESTAGAEHKIDGLAGATLTSNGVSNMIKFWMGENGYAPFLQRIQSGASINTRSNASSNDS